MFESIINFFKKLKKSEKTNSKDTAKERLHLVLAQDRANISADFLEMMKQEIIEVIKKYIEVDEKAIDVRLTNKTSEDGTVGAPSLFASIPIVTIKNEARKMQDINKEETKDIKPEEEKVEEKEEAKTDTEKENEKEQEQKVETETEENNKEDVEEAVVEDKEEQEEAEETETKIEEETKEKKEEVEKEIKEKVEEIKEELPDTNKVDEGNDE